MYIGLERCGLDTASTDFDSPSHYCILPEHHQASSRVERCGQPPRGMVCVYMFTGRVCVHPTGGFLIDFHTASKCQFVLGVLLVIRTSCPPGQLKMSQLKWVLPKFLTTRAGRQIDRYLGR